jgi:threonyl-tRNA synthetase
VRVRSISIDDGHIFCRKEDIEHEFTIIMEMIKEMYRAFDMEFRARLSFRDDSDEYLGDREDWDEAQKIIEEVAKKLELNHEIVQGDAAFYGPKIDIMVTDSLGREWQCATQQLDFVMPKRFNLTYTNTHGEEQPLVMIHKALLGSFERFLSVYLEHTNGHFPLWLAPEQLRVATLNDQANILEMAKGVVKKAKAVGIRAELDDSNESVGKKVRDAQVMKVPYTVVIGGKEVESGRLSPRHRADLPELPESSVEELLERLFQDAKSRK